MAESDRGRRVRARSRLIVTVLAVRVVGALLVTVPRWRDEQLAVPAASPGAVDSDATPSVSGHPGPEEPPWPGCAAAGAFDQSDVVGPPPGARAVPSGFQAVQVRRCTQDVRPAENGDQVQVDVEQEAAVTAEFLSYLAQPSVTPDDDKICPMNLVEPPWLVLLDREGRYVAPVIPTGECGFPLGLGDPGGVPYDVLRYRDVSAEQVRVIESDEAQKAGCPMEHKNMLTVEPPGRPPEHIDGGVFGVGPVRRCDYTADPGDPGVGTFAGGGPVTPAELTAFLESAAAVPAGGQTACTAVAEHFSVLSSTSNGSVLYVETDGCRRLLLQT